MELRVLQISLFIRIPFNPEAWILSPYEKELVSFRDAFQFLFVAKHQAPLYATAQQRLVLTKTKKIGRSFLTTAAQNCISY